MLTISEDNLIFLNSIYEFLTNLREHKSNNKFSGKKKTFIIKIILIFKSVIDLIRIMTIIRKRKYTGIVFIGPNLLNYEDFLITNKIENCLYINYHTTKNMGSPPFGKVYNLGILAGLFNRIANRHKDFLRNIKIYNRYYNLILSIFPIKDIYIPCFYDQIGLALIFDDKRDRYNIIEVQHGSICNFYPYSFPVAFKVSDKIFVNNKRTEEFLRQHLYKNIEVEILQKGKCTKIEGPRISSKLLLLYCSSIEVNGIHNVMLNFLKYHFEDNSFKLRIRLHPREKDKEFLFKETLNNLHKEFEFDNSKNWLDNYSHKNLVVITPWSSVVEEAYDNNIISIIIDPYGKERFFNIIDNNLCYYSTDLNNTIKEIINRFEGNETI